MNKLFYSSLLIMAFAVSSSCTRTTIYIVRHAEKDTLEKNNPALTSAGLQRAQDLAALLKDQPITHIYSTNFIRTISTAQPTADEHHVAITLYDSIPQLMSFLSLNNNMDILIVGHSNTILEIAKALDATPLKKEIADSDFDNVFIIKKQGFLFWKWTNLKETTYGTLTLP